MLSLLSLGLVISATGCTEPDEGPEPWPVPRFADVRLIPSIPTIARLLGEPPSFLYHVRLPGDSVYGGCVSDEFQELADWEGYSPFEGVED